MPAGLDKPTRPRPVRYAWPRRSKRRSRSQSRRRRSRATLRLPGAWASANLFNKVQIPTGPSSLMAWRMSRSIPSSRGWSGTAIGAKFCVASGGGAMIDNMSYIPATRPTMTPLSPHCREMDVLLQCRSLTRASPPEHHRAWSTARPRGACAHQRRGTQCHCFNVSMPACLHCMTFLMAPALVPRTATNSTTPTPT